jgi:3D (Asp-Asp-Asp) domain-containing protein/peptidoglycan hydrolase CwlO-like protein
VLADLRAGEESALVELYAADSAVARAEKRTAALESRLASVRDRVAETRRSLQISRDNLQVARELLNQRIEQWYRAGEIDAIEIVLASDSFADVIDQFDAIRRMSARNADVVEATKASAADAADRGRVLAEQERMAERLTADARAETDRLRAARAAKEGVIGDLRRQAAFTEGRIAQLDRAAQEASARADTIAAEHAASAGGGEPASQPPPDTGGGAPPPPPAAPATPAAGDGQTLVVQATAYSIHGTTASGLPTASGVCATDPSVIPMGTRFSVPGYGTCVAADTGSAIIGNIIDVWFPELGQAQAWGRRTLTITILG